MSGEWTYHLQNARTDAWLTRDLPLEEVEIVDVLTGDCSMTGVLRPEDDTLDDLIEEWGNFLWAEKGGQIRAGGILTTSRLVDGGNGLKVTVEGFTRYPHGQTYGGKYRLWAADPLEVVRHIWTWLQARSGSSNLNLVVDNDTSPVKISDDQPPAKPQRGQVTYPAGSPYGTAGNPWPRPPRPRKPKKRKPKKRDRRAGESQKSWDDYLEDYNEALDEWQDSYNTLNKGRLKPWRAWRRRLRFMRRKWEDDYGDREPYKLSWWEETDMGEELDRLAQEGGFEWRERHTWNGGGPDGKGGVNHRLQLGYPTIGQDKRETVTLEITDDGSGVLVEQPEAEHGGEKYANHVLALGAGEGRKMRRVSVGNDDSRLRRVLTIARKRIKRVKRLERIAREERSYRVLLRHIDEVAVVDTTGTLGSLRLGDTISVRIVRSYWKSGKTAHRIIGRRYQPDNDDIIYLQLERAERGVTE